MSYWKNNDLDERQIQVQNQIYRNVLVGLLIAILANAFLRHENIIWAPDMWPDLLIIGAVASVSLILMICKDAFNDVQRRSFWGIGIIGVALLIGGTIHCILRDEPVFMSNGLGYAPTYLLCGVLYFSPLATYLVRRRMEKNNKRAE